MTDGAQSIDIGLPKKLEDREYRRKFFLAEASARIAAQLVALRKRRGLNQTQLAELANTQQPAISRAERADYQNWSFNALRSIADALDARIRVIIEPAEDVILEYQETAVPAETDNALRAFFESSQERAANPPMPQAALSAVPVEPTPIQRGAQ